MTTTRLAALAASLDKPLLVTDLVNIFYLTGFDSSNAALLVRPGGEVSLHTDFRYIEAAHEVPDVEVVLSKRGFVIPASLPRRSSSQSADAFCRAQGDG